MISFAAESEIANLTAWSLGSFSAISWQNLNVTAAVIGVTLVGVFMMSKPIGAFALGEGYAQSMGINVKVFRMLLILTSSLLSACVTALAGPISFIGIAVPQIDVYKRQVSVHSDR